MGKRGGISGLARFLTAEHPEQTSIKDTDLEVPPAKKRKTGPDTATQITLTPTHETSDWVQSYDASGLVPHYVHSSEVPDHLQKYFAQRTRYFSLYEDGCLLDEEGWYSVTPERVADHIAERCRCGTILDAFCGVGGNAIAFAKTCERVIAMDVSPTRLALARHNAQIYGVADRIEFILGDYVSFAEAHLSTSAKSPRKIDVIFLSPPWGGPGYLQGDTRPASPVKATSVGEENVHPSYSLAFIQPIDGTELFNLSRKITRNIAYYLPRNTSVQEIAGLITEKTEPQEMVEIEEAWMSNKLKALTCYFGGLADGQFELFDL
ncbi:unnamed protein product [Mycena citricolor]|uniref:Trimethylguanosine synthase n=1 Tax=Mycena citricolor TaxID=2018698 RepID=A0AAD2Q4P4_9AGAR|nr:unnamed protein product [Mycena citricolor]